MTLNELFYDQTHLYSIDAFTAHLFSQMISFYVISYSFAGGCRTTVPKYWRNRFYKGIKVFTDIKGGRKTLVSGHVFNRHNRSFFVGAKDSHIHSRLWFISAIFFNSTITVFCEIKTLSFESKTHLDRKNLILVNDWLDEIIDFQYTPYLGHLVLKSCPR